jgi:hypothetical protein
MHSASYSLARFTSHHDDRESMHTPLEDVDEYEPLFPEDENKLQKAVSHVERFKKRPDALKHRFPSNDIWEDAPDYGMYQATVSTPDLPLESDQKKTSMFETPEQEAVGKGEATETDRKKQLAQKSVLPSHLQDEIPTRPGLQPRFPSQDIWEDSPDSFHLVTTVSTPPVADEPSPTEAPAKPMIPPRPQKSKLAEGTSATQPAPIVPARPARKSETSDGSPTDLKKVPSIPDRPKPSIPPRPAKKPSGDSLTKTISPGSDQSTETERAVPVASPPLTKVKPQIPARPGPSAKIAGLKGNFMNDLNQKLGLGPPKEKEPEPQPEVEAKPLEDARKGRARGPQRRAPAKSPSAAPAATTAPRMKFAISTPQSIWHIDDTGLLNVPSSAGTSSKLEQEVSKSLDPETAEVLENATVGQAPPPPTIDSTAEATTTEETSKPSAESLAQPAPEVTTDAAAETADPVLDTAGAEKPNPLSHQATNEAAFLSQQTTVSSAQASGPELEKVGTHETTIARTDTIGSDVPAPERKAVEEPIELRNEQVSASAPSSVKTTAPQAAPKQASNNDSAVTSDLLSNGNGQTSAPIPGQIAESGSDHAAEPMPENDVSYDQLEAMQSRADGKELSDGGMQKTVD